MLMECLELKDDGFVIYLLFFCRKQWWLGANMVTSHILMHTELMCKRAFIRDIIPTLCGISGIISTNDPAGKRQAPDACLNWFVLASQVLDFIISVLHRHSITFNCSRQVGTAILAMLSEDVLMSTLQSMSTSRGRETGGLKNGSVRLRGTQWNTRPWNLWLPPCIGLSTLALRSVQI